MRWLTKCCKTEPLIWLHAGVQSEFPAWNVFSRQCNIDAWQHKASYWYDQSVCYSKRDSGLPRSWYWDILTQSSLLLPFILLDLPSKGLKMEIVFKRLLTNDLLTTYLPSFLLLLMSYATTFFKPFYFEAAVTVNLSILLVITTLFVR